MMIEIILGPGLPRRGTLPLTACSRNHPITGADMIAERGDLEQNLHLNFAWKFFETG
jgi:hypothetical protein